MEPLGWRLGLERIQRLCSLLGLPQHRFASIHIVGTNGKTSVARMTAALLTAHGLRAGAYVSPHLRSWRERILISGEPIREVAFAGAIERCREAARVADRAADAEGPVTQFELTTAAAFVAFAAARLDVAVVEAGLGGRLDATNVLPSRLTVLTSVGLDHTEWLGETLAEIAAEKLAVLRDHTALVVGEVSPEVAEVAERSSDRRHARLIRAGEPPPPLAELVPAGYPRRNLGVALAAAAELIGNVDSGSVRRAGSSLVVPGRLELVPGDPPLIFDAAHNPDGAAALARSLPELSGGRKVVCCLAVLADKDAAGIAAALATACEAVVCTEIPPEAIQGSGRPGGSSLAAPELAGICTAAGLEADAIGDPVAAWRQARGLARERGAAALLTGSHYLLMSLWTER